MKRLLVFLVIMLALLGACAQEQAEYPTVEDEYAVYTAVLESLNSTNKFTVLINEKDEFPEEFHLEHFTEIISRQKSRFNSKGWEDYVVFDERKIDNEFDLPHKEIFLLSVDELNLIFSNAENLLEGWRNFYEKYPEALPWGYTWLSKVAFHPYRKEAVVYVGWQGDSLAGGGYYYYLKYVFGKWRVIEVIGLWRS